MMNSSLQDMAADLKLRYGNVILQASFRLEELTLTVSASSIKEIIGYLKNDSRYEFVSIIDICGVDWLQREERFDVVYHLLSPTKNLRVRVKISVSDDMAVESVASLFPGADWYEREVWDMYGIPFTNHPDLRRILTDYGFEGHPLRKDFPLTGFVELRYDDTAKRVVYEPVNLKQEFRNFDFLSPWEGPNYALPGDEKAEESFRSGARPS
jgi:NADH-quinone oxidoreductase subunit C